MKRLVTGIVLVMSLCTTHAQQKTYCNPINIDYGYTPIPNFSEWGRHRATADPVIVTYKGDYYLFSTNQWGYWYSSDMLNWKISAVGIRLSLLTMMVNCICTTAVVISFRCME